MINPNNLCPGCMNEKVVDGKCPICGYNPDEPASPMFLAPSSILDARYCIGKVLEQNSEGVTYIGYDTVTATTVNIREFFPAGLCDRDTDGATVVMLSGSEYSYNDALTKFIELSRELFRLNDLPALFDVLDVRESNNTAYRITRSVPGISLREFLMRNGGVLKWDQARSLFAPLIASVSALHESGIIHRGISPDTLIVGKDGKLRITGFCIPECRTAKSSLTSQLFPGFAAVEQYGTAGTQGPWTDVYAFAATIYRTLVGNPPPEAIDRLENDNMTIPAKVAKETPKAVLETLANALQVLPNDRTQSIDAMRHGLSVSSAQISAAAAAVKAPAQPERRKSTSTAHKASDNAKQSKNTGKMYGLVAGIVTAFLLAIVIAFVLFFLGVFDSDDSDTTSSGNGLSGLNSMINSDQPASKTASTGTQKFELYSFLGKTYLELTSSQDYADLVKFKVTTKQYSDEYAAGQVISQSPKAGEITEIGTTVEVVLSLGPSSIKMPDITGLSADAAKLKLCEAGFTYQNITVKEKYDDTAAPGVVIESEPQTDVRVSVDAPITIITNSFQGQIVEPPKPNNPIDGTTAD